MMSWRSSASLRQGRQFLGPSCGHPSKCPLVLEAAGALAGAAGALFCWDLLTELTHLSVEFLSCPEPRPWGVCQVPAEPLGRALLFVLMCLGLSCATVNKMRDAGYCVKEKVYVAHGSGGWSVSDGCCAWLHHSMVQKQKGSEPPVEQGTKDRRGNSPALGTRQPRETWPVLVRQWASTDEGNTPRPGHLPQVPPPRGATTSALSLRDCVFSVWTSGNKPQDRGHRVPQLCAPGILWEDVCLELRR